MQVEQEYERFFELSLRNQHDEFAQFSLPKQFDIFIYTVLKRHPSDYSFAYDIASIRGKEVVPFLVDRLLGSSDEIVQQSIIYIFEALVREGHELRFNDSLIKLIRDKISLMKQPFSKQASERSLKVILGVM
jgi:hypothetical protein